MQFRFKKEMSFVTFNMCASSEFRYFAFVWFGIRTVLFFMLEIRQTDKPNIDIHLFFCGTLVFDKITILNLNVTLQNVGHFVTPCEVVPKVV